MFNSSFHLAKFSPLKTPEIQKAAKKRHSGEDGYLSGASAVSSVTADIQRISNSIQKKLKSGKRELLYGSGSEESLDDSLFITQEFSDQVDKKEKEKKSSKSRKKGSDQIQKKSKADLSAYDTLSEPDSVIIPPQIQTKVTMKPSSSSKQIKKSTKSEDILHHSPTVEYTKLKSPRRSSTSVSKGSEKKSVKSDSISANIKLPAANKASKRTSDSKSKTHSISSSSDSESNSSSISVKDKEVFKRLKAGTKNSDDTDSDSDNDSVKSGSIVASSELPSINKAIIKTDNSNSETHSDSSSSDSESSSSSISVKDKEVFRRLIAGTNNSDTTDSDSVNDSVKSGSIVADNELPSTNKASKKTGNSNSETHSDSSSYESESSSSSVLKIDKAVLKRLKGGTTNSNATDSESGADSDGKISTAEVEKDVRKSAQHSKHSVSDSESDSTESKSASEDEAIVDQEGEASAQTKHQLEKTKLPTKQVSFVQSKENVAHHSSVSEMDGDGSDSEGSDDSISHEMVKEPQKTTILRVKKIAKSSKTRDEKTRQNTEHWPDKNASKTNKRRLKYQPPIGFDTVEQKDRYVTHEEMDGKQIWLIQTPVDFDIATLHNQEITLDGLQTINAQDKSEKQYEVICRQTKDKQAPGYCSVANDEEGNFTLGAGISGQIQVLDWIPGIPPVKIDAPRQQKHEIPDNLKLRYIPFGADSPEKMNDTPRHGHKRKHDRSEADTPSKKKKKKRKKDSRSKEEIL